MDTARLPIKAILFDWAGVFCTPGEPFSHTRLVQLTGLSVDEMGQATYTLQERYYRGSISTDEFWKQVIKQFNLPLSMEDLSTAYRSSYRLYPEMLELAKCVRAKVQTALLSNLTSEMMQEILRVHHVERYFDHVIFSNEIGHMKPEPESFAFALRRLEAHPHETLFIDDSKANIDAASAMGIQTYHFLSPDQCLRDLSALVGFEV